MEYHGDFDTSAALGELVALVKKYDVPIDIQPVADVQAACIDRGIAETNPFLSATVLRVQETGRYLMLIADPVTSAMAGSAIGHMTAHGMLDLAEHLRDARLFAHHLVLHEIAHALDHSRSETQCDLWAFGEMGIAHAA